MIGDPSRLQFAVQPDAQRRRLDTHAIEAIRGAFKSAADRLWLRAYLDLANRDTLAVHDAKNGFLKTDVQSNVKFQRSSPTT
jgi:hypothetical protein